MNVTGTASLATFPAIVTATTAEESLRLAMGESYVPMPDVLVGTKNLAGELNAKIVHVAEVAEVAEEVDSEMLPVVESVIVEDLTSEGELNEVIGFSSDNEGNWAWVRDESGTLYLVSEDEWETFYGEAGTIELMDAVDRAWLASKRRELKPVAA